MEKEGSFTGIGYSREVLLEGQKEGEGRQEPVLLRLEEQTMEGHASSKASAETEAPNSFARSDPTHQRSSCLIMDNFLTWRASVSSSVTRW